MANDNNVEIRVTIVPNYVTDAEYEEIAVGPPRSEWNAMTDEAKSEYLDKTIEGVLNEHVNAFAEVDGEA